MKVFIGKCLAALTGNEHRRSPGVWLAQIACNAAFKSSNSDVAAGRRQSRPNEKVFWRDEAARWTPAVAIIAG